MQFFVRGFNTKPKDSKNLFLQLYSNLRCTFTFNIALVIPNYLFWFFIMIKHPAHAKFVRIPNLAFQKVSCSSSVILAPSLNAAYVLSIAATSLKFKERLILLPLVTDISGVQSLTINES